MIKFLFMVIYITYENENVSEVFFLYLYLYGMVWYDMVRKTCNSATFHVWLT